MVAWGIWCCIREGRDTFRYGVLDHRLDPEADLLVCCDQQFVFVHRGASELCVEVYDEGGEVGGFLPNKRNVMFYVIVNDLPPVYRAYSG